MKPYCGLFSGRLASWRHLLHFGTGLETVTIAMKSLLKISALFALFATSACGGHGHSHTPVLQNRSVLIEVEVYDPISGFVWEDVGVRIVQADQEWTGDIHVNPLVDDWYYTDAFGLILFSAADLALADIGFKESGGLAVISPDYLEDEATVLLEVSAPGLGTVYQSVDLSWDSPTVFVSIPF